MSRPGLVLTIDGPAGVGKSSVARRVAQRLGWTVLDSGVFYRVLTLVALREGADPADEAALVRIGREMEARLRSEEPPASLLQETGERIREADVTAAVPVVAAHPGVRDLVATLQRRFAARHGPVVMEGRDTGTVVFPDAAVKVYLDAEPGVRATRRHVQEGGDASAEGGAGLARTRARLEERDRRDRSREAAPLRPADDAWVLDTTRMSLEEVVEAVLAHVRCKIPMAEGGASGV